MISLKFIFNIFLLINVLNAGYGAKSAAHLTGNITVTFLRFPAALQLYPRDGQDSAQVLFSGSVQTLGYDSLLVITYKNNGFLKRNSIKLIYSGGNAAFSIAPKIHAELSEYKFVLFVKNTLSVDSIAARDSIICGDVYLINGQSNSHPVNPLANYRNEYCRSFGKNTNYTAYNPADTLWGLARGEDAVNFHTGVWGIKLQQLIVETFGIPVCIINGGSGGSTIEYNLRNNSNHTDLNTTYGRLLYRAIKAGVQNNVKALMWYQGESNCDSTWVNYQSNFNMLRSQWLENYPDIKKIYVFQIRMGCVSSQRIYQSQLREVHRILHNIFPDVELMSTVGVQGHDGCHYNFQGYNESANNIFRLIAKDFYKSTDTINIKAPNIVSAFFTSPVRNQVRLIFSDESNLIWPQDTLSRSLKDYFYFDSAYGLVSSYSVNRDTLTLNLNSTVTASAISYLPNIYYNGTTTLYQGPWLRNSKRVAALSFFRFPISNFVGITNNNEIPQSFYLGQNYPNPFNPETKITFEIAKNIFTKLTVYDILGREISTLVNHPLRAGSYYIKWNASQNSSGIYFYKLTTPEFTDVKKMVLIK